MKRTFDTAGLRAAAVGLSAAMSLYGCGGSSSTNSVTPELDQKRAAASATAQNNAECNSIRPFYWEIGDQSAALASGSVSRPGGAVVGADEVMSIASASKWLYSTYFVQRQHGALTATDVKYFNFWSGYTNLVSCSSAATVQDCLDQDNGNGATNGTFSPETENLFDYDGGHMQRHAADNGLGALDSAGLASELRTQLGSEVDLSYGQPQLAGGVFTSAQQYAKVLRKILDGRLAMRTILGTHPVCVDPASCPLALSTPSPKGEQWHYSIGHWVEDDPAVGDGALSSPGAFGFYPWIDAGKTWYGIVARADLLGAIDSVRCGRLIRKAWLTGATQ
jgi:hypothetical protein